ncbi:MAG TPA: flagellar biosynthesis anti-sigma factor FlgM [Lysobacter sp.]|nr:flagellar biosynthesis anti-sigma factor FlgM [Lysobacter sp.]
MAHKTDDVGPIAAPSPEPPVDADVTLAGGARLGVLERSGLAHDALELALLRQELAHNPSMDRVRIEALRHALQAGDYRVNAAEIAARLLQLEREFGS